MVETLLFLTYLTIRKSVKKKLDEAKANLDVNGGESKYFANMILKESKKESRAIQLFMTIALVYFVAFLPDSIFNIVIKNGGADRQLGPVLFLRWQIGLFALLVSSAIFDPLLTLYMKHDYQRAFVKLFRRLVPSPVVPIVPVGPAAPAVVVQSNTSFTIIDESRRTGSQVTIIDETTDL